MTVCSASRRSGRASRAFSAGGASGSRVTPYLLIRSSVCAGVEPLVDDQRGAGRDGPAEDGVQAERVEHRQHAEDDVLGAHPVLAELGKILHVRGQRAMGQHRGARIPTRPGRVEQDRERLRVELRK